MLVGQDFGVANCDDFATVGFANPMTIAFANNGHGIPCSTHNDNITLLQFHGASPFLSIVRDIPVQEHPSVNYMGLQIASETALAMILCAQISL